MRALSQNTAVLLRWKMSLSSSISVFFWDWAIDGVMDVIFDPEGPLLGVFCLNLRPIAALTFFRGWCSTPNFGGIFARFARRTELELALELQGERS